jgi:predicted Rossmann fold flavoprotein
MRSFDVIVLGAGAAGLFAAFTAGKRGRRVAVLEHNDRVGKKIAISGGGRCNFTNLQAGPANFLSGNPGFCRSALARFTPGDFVALVEKHGIGHHEKEPGQLFCNASARAITDLLLHECREGGVSIFCGCAVGEVSRAADFAVQTSLGEFRAPALVVATGGLSFPKLGATDLGYRIARRFGLHVTALRPGLVPLTWNASDRAAFATLSGISLPVVASAGKVRFAGALLFTHRGVSGPAILQISSFWNGRDPIEVDLLPGGLDNLTAGGSLPPQLSKFWPRRFVAAWNERHAPARPLSQCSRAERGAVQRALHQWPLRPDGTEGYPKAEVTCGGVDTHGLSSKSMEARTVPGLYFVGEVVDVTGWLGGYNFQWAWASGHAAGLAI